MTPAAASAPAAMQLPLRMTPGVVSLHLYITSRATQLSFAQVIRSSAGLRQTISHKHRHLQRKKFGLESPEAPVHRLAQPSTSASSACRWPSCKRQLRCPRCATLKWPFWRLPHRRCPSGPGRPPCPARCCRPSVAAVALSASFFSACSYSVKAADQHPAFSAAKTCKV